MTDNIISFAKKGEPKPDANVDAVRVDTGLTQDAFPFPDLTPDQQNEMVIGHMKRNVGTLLRELVDRYQRGDILSLAVAGVSSSGSAFMLTADSWAAKHAADLVTASAMLNHVLVNGLLNMSSVEAKDKSEVVDMPLTRIFTDDDGA